MQENQINLYAIAKLARLKLSESEAPSFNNALNDILKLFNALTTADTESIEPMAHPLDLAQRLREDKVTETDQHQLFQSIAPAVANDLYLVPKVLESE